MNVQRQKLKYRQSLLHVASVARKRARRKKKLEDRAERWRHFKILRGFN
jgi:hypothetical protein